jgi:hypothetical protein
MAHGRGRWTTASANGALALQARVRQLAEAGWGDLGAKSVGSGLSVYSWSEQGE